ncbi:single-stranded DNA-binding protein [Promicromonospora sp. NPDC057488]|uniref:single-stranded DNA-binding protein n=1 Tax=Promicromonospora sp. NPDC057488 TaxID=3346147 RepID=UPI00366CA49F
MNDVTVTVSGRAGNTPALHTGKDKEYAMLRVASTRRFVNDDGDWADGPTLWFTVKTWRTAAVNLARSVRKGDPVVVTGRLEYDQWHTAEGEPRSDLVIQATGVGVDATRGKVEYSRVVHHGAPAPAPRDADGMPVDPFGVDAPDAQEREDDEAGAGQRELVTA